MKKRMITTLAICTLILSAPLSVVADEIDNQIDQQDKKIKEISDKAASVQTQVTSVQKEVNDIQAKAETLAKKQIALRKEITLLDQEIEELGRRIEKRQGVIDQQARSMQVENNSTNFLSVIVEADSVVDALNRMYSANKMVNANNDLVKQQEADRNSVQEKQSRTEEALEEVSLNAIALETQKGKLVDRQYELEALQNELAAEKATEQDRRDGFVKAKEEAEAKRREEAELARAAAEANRQAQAQKDYVQSGNQSLPNSNNNSSAGSTTGQSNTNGTGNSQSNGSANISPTTPPPALGGGSIVGEAQKYLGTPYVLGGRRPGGFDCSGLTQYVYLQVTGKNIGATTYVQENSGTVISLSQLQPGDLVFWGSKGSTWHVGIFIGGGQFIHSPEPGDVVKITSISAFTPSFGLRVS